jgi:hypothetical protein
MTTSDQVRSPSPVITGLPDLALAFEGVDRDAVFERLNTLNMLHHLQLSGRIDVSRSLPRAIDLAEHFHAFLVENRMALDEVKSNTKALLFGRVSDITGMAEEFITREDPLRDILMQMVPFLLSAFSEHSYIRSAEIGHRGILRTYSLYLYSEVYAYLKDTREIADRDGAEDIAGMMNELYGTLDGLVGDPNGLVLYSVLFTLLYNLRIQEILNTLNQESAKTRTEV